MNAIDKMWAAMERYQEQADNDSHGDSWRVACQEKTTASLDAAGEDAGKRMKAADPEWELFCDRKWNDDYERLYVAGEALCSAVKALSAKTDAEQQKNADAAVSLIAQAQGIDDEDDT